MQPLRRSCRSTGVALLVVATLVAFLVFANGTTRLLRVQYLIERIAEDTRTALQLAFGDEDVVECARPDPSLPLWRLCRSRTACSTRSTSVRCSRWRSSSTGGWRSPRRSGAISDAILRLASCVRGAAERRRRTTMRLRGRSTNVCCSRTSASLLQDHGFGFRQLVDIAIRALSPAVNDPTTAVQVVDRLADLLGRIPDRPGPSGWFAGESGVARVHVPPDDFDELMTLAFAEIIRYGADSPQVARRVSAALDTLETQCVGFTVPASARCGISSQPRRKRARRVHSLRSPTYRIRVAWADSCRCHGRSASRRLSTGIDRER